MSGIRVGDYVSIWYQEWIHPYNNRQLTDKYRLIDIIHTSENPYKYTLILATKGAISEETFGTSYSNLTLRWERSKITRDEGNWCEDGFQAGDTITVKDTEKNNGQYIIWSISEDGRTIILDLGNILDPEEVVESEEITNNQAVAITPTVAATAFVGTMLQRAGLARCKVGGANLLRLMT